MESPNSSAFSVTSAPSVISDVYDIDAHAENGNSDPRDSANCAPLALDKVPAIPEHDGKSMFEPGDGDAVIEINGTRFEVHKYLLKRFAALKSELNGRASEVLLSIRGGEAIVEDFRNTFKVLYATVLEGPFDFDNSTLVSALRIATTYGYPALRTYTVGHLEDAQLAAIERIKIAREFGLATWEEPAYVELCERDDPISREEANILGVDMFVRVAEIREREQRRKGKEVDARQHGAELKGEGGDSVTGLPVSTSGSQESAEHTSAIQSPEIALESVSHDKALQAAQEDTEGAIAPRHDAPGVDGVPSFLETQTGIFDERELAALKKGRPLVRVTGCNCRFQRGKGNGSMQVQSMPCQCAITPCAVAALKNLQVNQFAHANDIAALKSAMNKFTVASSALPQLSLATASVSPRSSPVFEAVHHMLSTPLG